MRAGLSFLESRIEIGVEERQMGHVSSILVGGGWGREEDEEEEEEQISPPTCVPPYRIPPLRYVAPVAGDCSYRSCIAVEVLHPNYQRQSLPTVQVSPR